MAHTQRSSRLSRHAKCAGYKSPPQMFQPLKISDPSMKKINLYKVLPKHKFNSYARKQGSVFTRNIADERALKINLDVLPQVGFGGVGYKGPSPTKMMTPNVEASSNDA